MFSHTRETKAAIKEITHAIPGNDIALPQLGGRGTPTRTGMRNGYGTRFMSYFTSIRANMLSHYFFPEENPYSHLG